jgi:hypothetical protein
MSKLTSRLREPLSTIDKRIVTVVGLLFVIAFALVNATSVTESSSGCVEAGHAAPVGSVMIGGPVTGSGTSVTAATARLCPNGDPSGSELAMSYGAKLPGIVFAVIALLLLCRFLWGAVRPGLHSPVAPGRLRTLGWFVLAARPITSAVQHFFRYELASSLISKAPEHRAGTTATDFNGEYTAWWQELQMDFPWWCVFAGVSALVVAKLLRVEVRVAEELAGTI